MSNLYSSVQLYISRVSVANKWNIKLNMWQWNSASTSNDVLFCLLHKHTINNVFDDFQRHSKNCVNATQTVQKISKDNQHIYQTLHHRYHHSVWNYCNFTCVEITAFFRAVILVEHCSLYNKICFQWLSVDCIKQGQI